MSEIAWTARLEDSHDGSLTVVVTAELLPGWHINPTWPQLGAHPTTIAAPEGSAYSLTGPVTEPAPTWVVDPVLGGQSAHHEGVVEFKCPVALLTDGGRPELAVTFQACAEEACLMPVTVVLPVSS